MKPRSFFICLFVGLAAFCVYHLMALVWGYHTPQGVLEQILKKGEDISAKDFQKNVEFMQYATTILGGIIIIGQICRSWWWICEECGVDDTVDMVFPFFIGHFVSFIITIASVIGIFYLCTEVDMAFVLLGAIWIGLMVYAGWQGIDNDKHYTLLGIGYALHQYANDLWDNQAKKVEFTKNIKTYLSTSKY